MPRPSASVRKPKALGPTHCPIVQGLLGNAAKGKVVLQQSSAAKAAVEEAWSLLWAAHDISGFSSKWGGELQEMAWGIRWQERVE